MSAFRTTSTLDKTGGGGGGGGALPMPMRGNSRTRRRRRKRRGNNARQQDDSGDDSDNNSNRPKMRRLVGMVPNDSGAESTAFNPTDSEYMTSDHASSVRAVRAAREHHMRVQRALKIETSDESDSNESSESSEFEAPEQNECEVPDDSRRPWTAPSTGSAQNTLTHQRRQQQTRRRGGDQFGLNVSGIEIKHEQGGQPRCGMRSSVNVATNNDLANMRSTQIRRSVRRNVGTGSGGGGGAADASTNNNNNNNNNESLPNFGEIVIEGEEDRHVLSQCVDLFIDTVRNNPYYRFATEVAMASGHNFDQYFLSSRTRELLKLIDPSTAGNKRAFQRQSANEMKRDAEILRSAAYFIKSQAQGEMYTRNEKFSQQAREGANQLAMQSLRSIHEIHAEHVRMREHLRDARPIVHRRIYLSDRLISAIGPSMNELYERGMGRDVTADDIIMYDEHVRSMFAQLVGTKITAIGLKTGAAPALQAQYVAVGAALQRYAGNIITVMSSRTRDNSWNGPLQHRSFRPRYNDYGSDTRVSRGRLKSTPPLPDRSARRLRRLLT